MKRSYDDSLGGGGGGPSTVASPSSHHSHHSHSAHSPTTKRGRSSKSPSTTPSYHQFTQPSQQQPLPPTSSAAAGGPLSLFQDAQGRITRIPTISRKVRACASCKKQKIRCDFEDGEGTCVRCKKMKLECVVNRSLQTILDEDVEWKHRMRDDTMQLQHAVEDILGVLNMRPLATYAIVSPSGSRNSSEGPVLKAQIRQHLQNHPQHQHQHQQHQQHPHSRPLHRYAQPETAHSAPPHIQTFKLEDTTPAHTPTPTTATTTTTTTTTTSDHHHQQHNHHHHTHHSQQQQQHTEEALFSSPMNSLYEVTRLRGLRNTVGMNGGVAMGMVTPGGGGGGRQMQPQQDLEQDFVERGILSLQAAQELFEIFRTHLTHYLYDVVLTHDTLSATRASSPLLSSAIFTVTALHVPAHHHLFPGLYAEFLQLVQTCMFDRHHRLDDVRGLCIGAFWLMDISWKLSGHAVRIATEMNCHQSFRKACQGSEEHFEKARLWYLLYVCDHHFSIAYGRPPVIHDHEPHTSWPQYLASPLATLSDSRVLSQVTLFVVMTRIYHFFADDPCDAALPDSRLSHLRAFNAQLTDWRDMWHERSHTLPQADKEGGIDLHYHFARLQLNSISLRGANPQTMGAGMSAQRREHADMAIASARDVLRIILDEPSIRESLVGVPLYMNTMVAFAAVFLLKVTARWNKPEQGQQTTQFGIETEQVWGLVENVITLLNSRETCESHIIPHVASGLQRMLEKCVRLEQCNSPVDDQRLWGGANGHVEVQQQQQEVQQQENVYQTNGHPPPPQQQQQQQVWQSFQTQLSSAPPEGVLYAQAAPPPPTPPPPPPPTQNGESQPPPGLYEVNGQYYPMHMGVFDFLSPQLPY